jgi:hypothetical protein
VSNIETVTVKQVSNIESVTVMYKVEFAEPILQESRMISMGWTETTQRFMVHSVTVSVEPDSNVTYQACGVEVGKRGRPVRGASLRYIPVCEEVVIHEDGSTTSDGSLWEAMLDDVRDYLEEIGIRLPDAVGDAA